MQQMQRFFSKGVLFHPLVLSALGVVVVIAAGSGFYYVSTTRMPQASSLPAVGTTTEGITASGTVEPAQNPNLTFLTGGRVTRVSVAVGDKVYKGQLLASLDVAQLAAQRDQASANLKAAQAKLDSMNAGPRDTDVAAKRTAVTQAQTTLDSLYAGIPANIAQAYDKSFSGVSSDSDNLFSNPNTVNATLIFSTSNGQFAQDVLNDRVKVGSELSVWQSETNTLTSASPSVAIDIEITLSLSHLAVIRTYSDALLTALGNATPSSNFSSAQVAAAQTAVGTLRDTINTQILALHSFQQQIVSAKLAVTSANDALNQVLAGTSAQDIEAQQAAVEAAQASVESVNAQINNAIIVAPFAGTVGSVQVKIGDTVAPNTIAVALNPESALQITAYVSESAAGSVVAGQTADVTLDAYGSSQHFVATVVSIDRSPTMQANVPAYKVVLQFATNDPAISSGMTANVTIQK